MPASVPLPCFTRLGSLLYLSDGLPDLTANECTRVPEAHSSPLACVLMDWAADLVLAGTFHGLHAITARLSPTGSSSGVEVLEAETFKMTCLQTPTGKLPRTTSMQSKASD